MTTQVRYHPEQRVLEPPASAGRFDRPATTPMPESRANEVSVVRERVKRSEYEVDPQAVAEAIIQRLLAGGGLR